MLEIFIKTFGCQMNFLDSELIEGDLRSAGFEIADKASQADIILFNTCAVREHAEERVLSNIGALKKFYKKNPKLIVGVLGCVAQHIGNAWFEKFPFLKIIIGTHNLHRVPEIIKDYLLTGKKIIAIDENYEVNFKRDFENLRDKFAASIAVMRGCDHHCSYCIVPYVRGKEIHREIDEIVEEAKILVSKGITQLTLLGQNIDSYGLKLKPRKTLAELLIEVDKLSSEGLRRLFFITSHPLDIKDELFFAMKECPTVGRYLHLPVQSGSNRILKLMKRGYTSERYLEILHSGRAIVDNLEFAGDWIVGFPSETEEDFEATKKLLIDSALQFSYVFKYSPRPETLCMKEMQNDVSLTDKKRRNQELLRLQEEISLRKNRAKIGQEFEVLVEGFSKMDKNRQFGRTNQFQIAVWNSNCDDTGKFIKVKIIDATKLVLVGSKI